MATTVATKHLDVLEQVRNRFLVRPAVHPLILQAAEEASRRRVIPTNYLEAT